MADEIIKMRHHKLLFELKFLYADLNYHEIIMNKAATKFQSEFLDFCKEEGTFGTLFPEAPPAPPDQPAKTAPNVEEIYEPQKNKISKESKNLHKQIASMTHPDKLMSLSEKDKEHRSGIFLKAGEFAEKDDLFALQQIALDLGIDLGDPTEEQLSVFEKEAKRVREKIKKFTETFAWTWYHQEDDRLKLNLLKQYQNILMPPRPPPQPPKRRRPVPEHLLKHLDQLKRKK
jgi:hypothetical protein